MIRMQRVTRGLAGAVLVVAVTARAQEEAQPMPEMSAEEQAMMEAWQKAATPGPPHEMLAAMAGDWTFEGTFSMMPDQPPITSTGTVTRTMTLGGRVLVEKVTSSFMGQPFEGHGMTGYDNVTGTYWSTWMDNASTALMTSTGSCDQGRCEFTATVVDPMTGQPARMRMTSEQGPDSELHHAYEVAEDGSERLTMELRYTRAE